MAKIDHIEALTQRLSSYSSIKILPKRCEFIRNPNSKCHRCQTVCKHDAISLSVGIVHINPQSCSGCGACTVICPSSALAITNPTMAQIVKDAQSKKEALGGAACFVCEKMVKEHNINTELVTVLPCLDYLDEYILCGMLTHGFDHIAVLKQDCTNCKTNGDIPHFDAVLASCTKLLHVYNIPNTIRVFEKIPKALFNKHKHTKQMVRDNRREALHSTKESLSDYVKDSFVNTIEHLGESNTGEAVVRTNVAIDDVEPPSTYRSVRLLQLLSNSGKTDDKAIVDSHYWADLSIDLALCKACGHCARNCATRALHFERENPGDINSPATLIFSPSLCTGCELCHDICPNHAILLSHRVPAKNLSEGNRKVLYKNRKPPKTNNLDALSHAHH